MRAGRGPGREGCQRRCPAWDSGTWPLALLLFSTVALGVTSSPGPTVSLVVPGLGVSRDKRGAQLGGFCLALLSQNPVALRSVRTSMENSVGSDETVVEVRPQGGLTCLARSRLHKAWAQMGHFQSSEHGPRRGRGPRWENIQGLPLTTELPGYVH